MKKSLFIEFISGIWPKLALYVKEKVDPKERTYLHKTMLREVYSADQKWEGTSAKTTYVAADMVAMDSPLPIKKRGSLATSNGKLPKVGMKKILRETEINSINIMKAHYTTATTDEAKKAEKARIIQNLTNDGVACSVGIDEKNEANFLTGLCEGVVLVEDEENVGTGLRVNYGYLDENTFGTIVKGQISKEDFENVNDKAEADGNTIVAVMMSKAKLNEIRRLRWAQELVADFEGKVYDDDDKLKTPSRKAFLEAFEDEFGYTIQEINRTVIFEKNGKQKSVKPWNNDRLVFRCSEIVGSLVWGTLAEATNPVEGVRYATVDKYKLISKYSKNDPLQEFTSGQALVLPVIEDVDQIYVIDCTETKSAEVDETAEATDTEDKFVTINGKKYSKTEAIAQLKALGATGLKSNSSDAKVIEAFNALSDEDEATFLENVTEA
ncbi:MAG: hypothetical protein IJ064_05510 [Bacteroidaceae bacterium]|nr:hypothetical protein [Bacteroidaceae bacterium]